MHKIAEQYSPISDPQFELGFQENLELKIGENELSVLSLFSGCGGMDLGFEGDFKVHSSSVNENLSPDFIQKRSIDGTVQLAKNRFKTVFANDILKDARNTWINYFQNKRKSKSPFQSKSIVDLVKLHKSGFTVFPKNIDVVTGGFPCQDFSIAGKRKGFESSKNHQGENDTKIASLETRGQLYIWMKEVIEICKPKIFIAENVKGLVNLSNVKEIIQNDFSSTDGNGYIVLEPKVLHAANYGVPQTRERVFFIGIKKSELAKGVLEKLENIEQNPSYDPYPKPTHSFNISGKGLKQTPKLADIFETLDEPSQSQDLSQRFFSKAKFMGKHCQGQTEIKLNNVGPTIRAEHHGNIEFRRLSEKNGGKYLDELEKGKQERRLTPRECALIQTFPMDYEFVIGKIGGRKGSFLVSPSQAYKVIGNAVPPLLAYNLAKRLEKIWPLYFNESNDNIREFKT